MSKAVPPSRVHHIALEVSDMDKSIAFYRRLFGVKVTERHEAGEVEAIPVALSFLRFSSDHHDLVLAHNPAKTYRLPDEKDAAVGRAGIHHYAVQYPDRAAWLAQLDHVRAAGFEVIRGPVVHSPYHPRGEGSWGENESFYVFDPDGHRIEMFCDIATIADDGAFIDAYGKQIAGGQAEEF
ncbi:MAG: VOC family protein [Fimbriimonadaceae bacterium]|nr:VOC family protein [Alphaproteobacteria bacterium]